MTMTDPTPQPSPDVTLDALAMVTAADLIDQYQEQAITAARAALSLALIRQDARAVLQCRATIAILERSVQLGG